MSNKFREIFDQLDWHFEAWGVSINKNSKNAIEKTDLRELFWEKCLNN